MTWMNGPFRPPRLPNLDMPYYIRKVPGILDRIEGFSRFCYFEGVKDGFIAGCLAMLTLVVLAMLLRRRKD